MHLTIGAIGKLKPGPERELFQRYAERITPAGKPLSLGPLTIVELPESRKGSARERRQDEATALMAKMPASAGLIAMDEKGDGLSSEQFSRLVARQRDDGLPALAFLIGGPDGHGRGVRDNVIQSVSLGAITLPHALARVVLAEQLYRVITILSGHPYHRK